MTEKIRKTSWETRWGTFYGNMLNARNKLAETRRRKTSEPEKKKKPKLVIQKNTLSQRSSSNSRNKRTTREAVLGDEPREEKQNGNFINGGIVLVLL